MKNITPAQLTAWIGVGQLLAPVLGTGISKISSWIAQAHPAATPEETHAVYVAIMEDDTVRAALAALASRPAAPGA